jgi:surface antigen
MLSKLSMLLAATAVIGLTGAANADDGNHNSRNNQNNQHSPDIGGAPDSATYGNGYNFGYDDGYARRQRDNHYRSDPWRGERGANAGYDRGAYYYGSDCSSGTVAAGTVLGAIAGGAIGNHIGHGSGGATVAGVIVGGLAGNAISRDMDCGDRHYALTSYSAGFEGRIGERHDWRSADSTNHGSFTPTREYQRDGNTCRDFREMSSRDGRDHSRTGTACRQTDGNWYLQ